MDLENYAMSLDCFSILSQNCSEATVSSLILQERYLDEPFTYDLDIEAMSLLEQIIDEMHIKFTTCIGEPGKYFHKFITIQCIINNRTILK